MSSTQPTASATTPTTQQVYVRQSQPSQGGSYLKWKDLETKELVIVSGTATPRRVHWVDGKSADCTGPGCALCASGDTPKQRWCLAVTDEGAEQTWEMANTTFGDLETLAEMCGHLAGLTVKVKRSGSGKNTRYAVMVIADNPAPAPAPADFTAIKARIVRICQADGRDPSEQLHIFFAAVRPDLSEKDAASILPPFLEWIRATAKAPEQQPATTPTPTPHAPVTF